MSHSNTIKFLSVAAMILIAGCAPSARREPKNPFMISILWPPPWSFTNDDQYDNLKDAHINVVKGFHPSLTPHPFSSKWPTDVNNTDVRVGMQRKILDLAHARGMKVAVSDPRVATDAKAVVDSFKSHPALWGYFLKDEPSRAELPKYGKIYRELMKHDPDHIPFLNMVPAGPGDKSQGIPWRELLQEWIDAAGPTNLHYLVFDNYPFADLEKFEDPYYGRGRTHGHIRNYFSDLETVRKLGLEHDFLTGLYLQSVGIKDYLRRPDENDLRWNVYTALAYGIKSVQWFMWWRMDSPYESFTDAIIDRDGNKTDLYEPVKRLNAQMATLGPVLMTLDAVQVYHSGVIPEGLPEVPQDFFFKPKNPDDAVLISHMVNKADDRHYLMVVNKDNRSLTKHASNLVLDGPKTLAFDVAAQVTELTRVDKHSGKKASMNSNLKKHVFTDTFLPGEGKLYALPAGFAP